MAVPFINMVLHRYDGPVTFFAGVFVSCMALAFLFLSRCKIATQPEESPIIAGTLWVIAVIFGATALRLLYFAIYLYL